MTTQRDEPGQPDIETREQVLERIQHEEPAADALPREDPSTRGGFTMRLLAAFAVGAVVGYAITFVIIGFVEGWGPAFVWAFTGALFLGVSAALMAATDEDGRIARWVARREGPQPAPDETARDR